MRDEVLAAARSMLALGLASGTAGNVSGRSGDLVTITAAGEADDVVVLSLAGDVVAGAREPSSERALHLAVYRAYPEIGGVVHAHPPYATMFACARSVIPAAVDEFAIYVGGAVPCAAYAPSGSEALARNASELLREVGAVLLASHGLVAVGTSPADALHVAGVVERGAQSIWGALALGGAVPVPAEANAALAAAYRRRRSLRT
ncbi:MAG: L-fuculose-phosphate aldolase [Frankiaceae bacterium]|nr:L-fuculose-phosphate aldolase [Frankiaceae bacterium]